MPQAEASPRIFIDADVLFSAAYLVEERTPSLMALADRGRCILVISQYAATEARRNLERKRPERVPALDHLVRALELGPAPSSPMIERAGTLGLGQGDSIILAGAVASRADWLVTGDKAFWKVAQAVHRALGVEILSQSRALARLMYSVRPPG